MSDIGIGHPAPRRHQARFLLSTVATGLFALALVSDVLSGTFQPSCPPGWTRWDFEPGSAWILAIPVALLLIVSGVGSLRARRAVGNPRRGFPVATVFAGLLALLAALTLLVFASSLIDQITNPTAGCTTF